MRICCTILRMTTESTQTLHWHRLRGPNAAGVNIHRCTQIPMRAHDHLFHEIVYVEQGCGVHVTAAGRSPLRPGDVLVLRPQVWHAYEQTVDLHIINCLVDSRLISRFSSLLSQVPASFDLYRRRTRQASDEAHAHLHARPVIARQMLDRFNQIMQEQKHQKPGWQAAAVLGVMEILVACARLASDAVPEVGRSQQDDPSATKNEPVAPTRAHQAVQDATAIIESQYHKPISLESLAKRVHLSPGHLSRSFSKQMGMSVVSFIHRLRAEEACRLLIATHQPVTEIAAVVGYDEVAYFSRCFRQQLGVSPKAYRDAGRRDVQ